MKRTGSNDLDFLATRLHARRSRMAEGTRLEGLYHLRSIPELSRATMPGEEFTMAADFQRHLVQNLVREISDCLRFVEEEANDLIAWMLVRFQLENVKVLLRGFLNQLPLETLQPRLVSLPSFLALDAARLMAAKNLEDFAARLPPGSPRHRLEAMVTAQREPPQIFLLEAALDNGYFHELLARTTRLPGGEAEIVKPLSFQESNLFQFMLAVRGKFHFGLTAETLAPLRLLRSDVEEWFNTVLAAPDILAAAKCVVGIVIDALPAPKHAAGGSTAVDLPGVEALAWQRYLRLANSAFRRSHMDVGAVAGYIGVRRVEIANLISLSEGIRLGAEETEKRSHTLPRFGLEAAHV